MTNTETKRLHRDRIYLRKDARTQIYTALFGKQQHTYQTPAWRELNKRANTPQNDESRRFSAFWEWPAAKAVWEMYKLDADFSPAQFEALEERLTQLKRHPPHLG